MLKPPNVIHVYPVLPHQTIKIPKSNNTRSISVIAATNNELQTLRDYFRGVSTLGIDIIFVGMFEQEGVLEITHDQVFMFRKPTRTPHIMISSCSQ
jgi:hypothetical protein